MHALAIGCTILPNTAPLHLVVRERKLRGEERKPRLDQGIKTGETGVEVFQPIPGSSVEARPPRGVAEQVRKWGMKYDGQADPLEFLELLEERATTYGIVLDRMPRAVSEIFVDRAARWFLTSGLRDVTWAEFKSGFLEFFLPQRALDMVIGPEMKPHAFAYLDDIVLIGATKEQHVENLREVFRRLRAANLKQNRKKCSFFRKRLVYLGHVISGEGICTDPEKVEAIQNLKAPANCKEFRQCLGMASWYRRFVPNFATLVLPMTELLKKGRKWSWGEEQENALCQLKEKLTTAPVLACPDFSARGQRKRVLQECHDAPTAGHQGVKKTVSRLSQRYYWPGMFRDAARYVKCCEVCQKYKCEQRKPAGQMLTRQVAEPIAVLCADFMGPLPLSKRGNTMLLVFHGAFSKWVELVPLKRATAAHLQTAFRERILSSFGVPKKFVCDNGVQFASRNFQVFMNSLGIEIQHTAPYCPQENPTERTNRTVKTMIAQFIEGHQSSCDELLPEISLAVNSSVADSTGFSPAFLMHGREPRLPAALYDEVTPGSATSALDPKEKQGRLREIFNIVRSNLQRAAKDQSRHYNLRRREWRPSF
ncbi:hypothetical protein ACLKA7_004876 [Drosophila subpalustris]